LAAGKRATLAFPTDCVGATLADAQKGHPYEDPWHPNKSSSWRRRHPEGRLRGSDVNDFVIAYEARGISWRERVCRRAEIPPASE
jgi:hypothetical protein